MLYFPDRLFYFPNEIFRNIKTYKNKNLHPYLNWMEEKIGFKTILNLFLINF